MLRYELKLLLKVIQLPSKLVLCPIFYSYIWKNYYYYSLNQIWRFSVPEYFRFKECFRLLYYRIHRCVTNENYTSENDRRKRVIVRPKNLLFQFQMQNINIVPISLFTNVSIRDIKKTGSLEINRVARSEIYHTKWSA